MTEYILTEKSFWGETYVLNFSRGYTLRCEFINGTAEARSGTWELSGDTVTITWDDGETDEAALDPEDPDALTLNSTGEILEDPF